VYELDLEPHGQEIQDALLRLTGRRSVPNCFFCGTSHGGGSEMYDLQSSGALVGDILTHCKQRVSVDGQK
jgi:glutaredoxin